MTSTLEGRDLLSIEDLTKEEIFEILDTAAAIKPRILRKEDISEYHVLKGKHFVLYFEKDSLRTMLSFDSAIKRLGGTTTVLDGNRVGLGVREPIKDAASVIEQMSNGIAARVYHHEVLTDLAEYTSIPVINALSDVEHPCQTLGDLLTIREKMGRLEGVNIAYLGDGGNNVATSLTAAAGIMGMNLVIASPDMPKYRPNERLLQKFGRNVRVTDDPKMAVRGVDIVYTDVWTSMGQESEKEERQKDMHIFQVTEELMSLTNNASFMHCEPMHRGEEVTHGVASTYRLNLLKPQEGNRLYSAMGLFYVIFDGKPLII